MPLSPKRQEQGEKHEPLDVLKSAEGSIFEAGYADNSDKIDFEALKRVGVMTDDVERKIVEVYGTNHQAIFEGNVRKAKLPSNPASPKEQEERKAGVLKLAAEFYGPYFFKSEVLDGELDLRNADSKLKTLLAESLKDGVPANPKSLEGRKFLRAGLQKLLAIKDESPLRIKLQTLMQIDDEVQLDQELQALIDSNSKSDLMAEQLKTVQGLTPDRAKEGLVDLLNKTNTIKNSVQGLRNVGDLKGMNSELQALIDSGNVTGERLAQIQKIKALGDLGKMRDGLANMTNELNLTGSILWNLAIIGDHAELEKKLADLTLDGLAVELKGIKKVGNVGDKKKALLALTRKRDNKARSEFLSKTLGVVDYAEIVRQESKLAAEKEKLHKATEATNFFKGKKHSSAVSSFEGFAKTFSKPIDGEDEKNVGNDTSVPIDLRSDLSLREYMEAKEEESYRYRARANRRGGGDDPDKKLSERKAQNALKVKNKLKSLIDSKITEKVKPLLENLRVCESRGVQIRLGEVAGQPCVVNSKVLGKLISDFLIVGEDFSFNDVDKLFNTPIEVSNLGNKTLLGILKDPKFDSDKIAEDLAVAAGPLREEVGHQEQKVAKLTKKEKEHVHMSDEELALAVNKALLKKDPKTASLDDSEKTENAQARLLEDMTAMDNEDYFKRQVEKANFVPPKEDKITSQVLKFSYDLVDDATHKTTTVTPLGKLKPKDLDPDDDLALPRAYRAGRVDWKGLMVLMLSLEHLGEKASPRYEKVEAFTKKVFAAEFKVKPYSAAFAELFDDQVKMLVGKDDSPINKFYKELPGKTTSAQEAQAEFVKKTDKKLEEGLRGHNLSKEQFEDVVKVLKDNGYFTANRVQPDGTIAASSEEVVMASLKAMFEDIPKSQKRRERAKKIGSKYGEVGKKAGKKGWEITKGGVKWYIGTAPLKMLEYGAFRPLAMGLNMLTHPFHPIKAAKGSIGKMKTAARADAMKVVNTTKDLGKRAVTGTIDSVKNVARAGWEGATQKVEVHKSGPDIAKLKDMLAAESKKTKKPVLTLHESPFLGVKGAKAGIKAEDHDHGHHEEKKTGTDHGHH